MTSKTKNRQNPFQAIAAKGKTAAAKKNTLQAPRFDLGKQAPNPENQAKGPIDLKEARAQIHALMKPHRKPN